MDENPYQHGMDGGKGIPGRHEQGAAPGIHHEASVHETANVH